MASSQLLVRRAEFADADALVDLIGDQSVVVRARFGDVDIPWLMYLCTPYKLLMHAVSRAF